MRKVSFTQPAAPGEVFAQGAFDDQVGKCIPFRMENRAAGSQVHAYVRDVKVAPDGRSVHMTLEVMDGLNW
jgi:hypothetical protein